MQSPNLISGPLSLGDLLDRTFRLYRARIGRVTLTAAVLLVPVSLLSSLLTGRFMVGYMDLVRNMTVDPSAPIDETEFFEQMGGLFSYFGFIMLFTLLTMAALSLVTLAVSAQTIQIMQGHEPTLGESLRAALRRFWPMIGMLIVRGLAIMGATIAMLIVLGIVFFLIVIILGGAAAVFGGIEDEIASSAAIIGVVVLGICLYILAILIMFAPAIYFTARWIVAVPGLVAEGLGPVACLQRSWELTQRGVWRVIGYVFLLGLLNLIVIAIPVWLIQLLLTFALLPTEIFLALSTAASSILSIIWQPLYSIAIVLLYYDLRVRRESYDLTLQIDQMEADVQASQP